MKTNLEAARPPAGTRPDPGWGQVAGASLGQDPPWGLPAVSLRRREGHRPLRLWRVPQAPVAAPCDHGTRAAGPHSGATSTCLSTRPSETASSDRSGNSPSEGWGPAGSHSQHPWRHPEPAPRCHLLQPCLPLGRPTHRLRALTAAARRGWEVRAQGPGRQGGSVSRGLQTDKGKVALGFVTSPWSGGQVGCPPQRPLSSHPGLLGFHLDATAWALGP